MEKNSKLIYTTMMLNQNNEKPLNSLLNEQQNEDANFYTNIILQAIENQKELINKSCKYFENEFLIQSTTQKSIKMIDLFRDPMLFFKKSNEFYGEQKK